MTDYNPRLAGLASSRGSLIFERLCLALQADPQLAGVVREWRTWDGAVDPLIKPSISLCPFVRLTPIFGAGRGRDNVSQQGRLSIAVEIATAGYYARDPIDVFSRMTDVLFARSQATEAALRHALRDLGAMGTSIDVEQPAGPAAEQPDHMTLYAGRFGVAYRIQG